MEKDNVDEEKVMNFMAITECKSRDVAIQMLEMSNWDEISTTKSSLYKYNNLILIFLNIQFIKLLKIILIELIFCYFLFWYDLKYNSLQVLYYM